MKNKSVILNEVKNPAVNYAEVITLVSLALFIFLFSGCIRLTGNAGYWKKDAETEEYQGKSVNLDSDDLIYPDRAKGSITT